MKRPAALLLAALMCLSLFGCGSESSSGNTAAPGTPGAADHSSTETPAPAEQESTEPEPTPGIALSDDLADFTVSIDGTVYQFPCSVQSLLDDGWQSVSGDSFYTMEVSPGRSVQTYIYREKGKDHRADLSIIVNTPGDSACPATECVITYISQAYDDETEVILAGGFKLTQDLTLADITDRFGEGQWDSRNIYYQYTFATVKYTFKIKENHLDWWSIEAVA